MKLLRRFPLLCFALVLLSILGLCVAQRSVELLVVAGTLAAVSWYITEGPRGRSLPRWVSNLLVIAVCLNVIIDVFQNAGDAIGVLGRFAVWLTLIKLYERRTARDHAHLMTLSALLMMTGCLQSSDLLFGLILLAYALLGLYVLLLYQLHASYEKSRTARQAATPAGYGLVPPVKPIIGRRPVLHFRSLAGGLMLAGLGLSLFVFFIFPRDVGADMLSVIRPAGAAQTPGFSWSVDLNSGGRINDSRVRAFTLQVRDAQGQGAPPVAEGLLLRGAVLDLYEGNGRWTSAPTPTRRLGGVNGSGSGFAPLARPAGEAAPADESGQTASTLEQRFTLSRSRSGSMPLFSMYAPIAVSFAGEPGAGTESVIYDPRRQTLKTAESAGRISSYVVRAQPQPSDAALERLTDRSRLSRRGEPRIQWAREADELLVRELAEARLSVAGVPPEAPPQPRGARWQWNAAAAAALTAWFHSGEFTYTLDLSDIVHRGSRQGDQFRQVSSDPIVRFLQLKRGHCEYFASALAALCHAVDVPARVVVGYIAYDYDQASRQYIVLERNAHAWVEVAVGPHRWMAFDPTPPAVVRQMHELSGESATLSDQFRWMYEGLEGNWSNTFIQYDSAAQTQLANTISQGWSARLNAGLERIRDWMARVNAFFNVGPGGYIWMGIVASALVIAVIALVKLMRRSLAIRRTLQLQHVRGAEYQRMLRQLGFYLDMLRVLKRGGIEKPAWQPPLQFAWQLALTKNRQAAEPVEQLSRLFYQARYGGRKLTREQAGRARTLLEKLAASLKVKL